MAGSQWSENTPLESAKLNKAERGTGIEPAFYPWEGYVLPLY